MACKKNSFDLIGRHMRRRSPDAVSRLGEVETPTIADLIRRIDLALMDRRAA